MNSRATSFATYQDLTGYIKCLQSGGTSDYCYNEGDNGEGAWGDRTATEKVAMVALDPHTIAAKWGTSSAGRGKKVRVKLRGVVFDAEVRDKGPKGVIDLNPGALKAAGLHPETELNEECEWEWV